MCQSHTFLRDLINIKFWCSILLACFWHFFLFCFTCLQFLIIAYNYCWCAQWTQWFSEPRRLELSCISSIDYSIQLNNREKSNVKLIFEAGTLDSRFDLAALFRFTHYISSYGFRVYISLVPFELSHLHYKFCLLILFAANYVYVARSSMKKKKIISNHKTRCNLRNLTIFGIYRIETIIKWKSTAIASMIAKWNG